MGILPKYEAEGYIRQKRSMVSTTSSSVSGLRKYLSKYWHGLSSHTRRKSHSILTSAPIPAEALIPTASTRRFVLLCMLWYSTSALSSNTGKAILTQFRYPITLTFVQFGFVAGYCLVIMGPPFRFSRLRQPSKVIIKNTFPMGLFQVGGHIFASMAISRIPVSTVHTIKALSPLFTVAAYALLFSVSYSWKTYISLLPLTIGVMLACTFDTSSSNIIGTLCAFGSAIIFVTQNIYFKKIVPSFPRNEVLSTHASHKLDKINLLFYSSSMAFILMIPIWMYYDLSVFLSASPSSLHPTKGHSTAAHPNSVPTNFFLNGTVHFAQSILAFVILSSTSPVTYSIASLIKRVAVICIAIAWFKQRIHPVQAFGIALTFVGLWMYNSAKGDGSVEKGERKRGRLERAAQGILPSTMDEAGSSSDSLALPMVQATGAISGGTYPRPRGATLGSPTGRFSHPHGHHPPHPLHIQILPSTPVKAGIHSSPKNSYPSPPPSLDSPTEKAGMYELDVAAWPATARS